VLTRTGASLAALTAACFVVGVMLRYNELLVVAASFLIVEIAAIGWMVSRPRIHAERQLQPNRVVAGTPATGELTVTNNARRRSPAMTVFEQFGAERAVEVAIPGLDPGESHATTYALPTDRRGVFDIGPLNISRSDPFGLMETGQDQRSSERLWVHPIAHQITPFPTGAARDLDGPTSGQAPQGGIAFHTLREYVFGDDLRLVHWRSTARRGKLMVRHNVDTNQPRTLVIFDTRAVVHSDESFEDAVRAVASIVTSSYARRFPVRVRTSGGRTFGSDRGERLESMMDALAELEPTPEPTLADLRQLTMSDRGGYSLAFVTGTAPASDLVAIGPLRSRFDTVTICRLGAKERGTIHELPGAVLINAGVSTDFAHAWNRRVRR
jgi:uncharacterized protein (DUF58 family)